MPRNDVKPALAALTELQLKCLEGFWNRRPAKQIAADLGISEAWVNKNLMAARRTLHVGSSADAAALVFGAKPGSIKNYYYQESSVPPAPRPDDQAAVLSFAQSVERATCERPLINRFGPLTILFGIVLVAFASILGVTLMIDAGDGLYQLWKALGH